MIMKRSSGNRSTSFILTSLQFRGKKIPQMNKRYMEAFSFGLLNICQDACQLQQNPAQSNHYNIICDVPQITDISQEKNRHKCLRIIYLVINLKNHKPAVFHGLHNETTPFSLFFFISMLGRWPKARELFFQKNKKLETATFYVALQAVTRLL